MAKADQFPKAPPIRFKLTKGQADAIEQAKPPGDSIMVMGYAQRHPWPHPEAFTLCAWFIAQADVEEGLKASGIMAKRKPRKATRRATR